MKIDGDGSLDEIVGADRVLGARAVRQLTKAEAYAASLVQLAKSEASLDIVDRDLRLVKETVAGHMGLRGTLTDADLPVQKKQAVVDEIFTGKISEVTLRFLGLLVGIGQIELLSEVAEEFADRLQAEENKAIAEITTAIPLDPDFMAKLTARLSELTGKLVTLRPRVDADIIGGLVIRVDGKLIDASVRQQLERLKNQMLVDVRGR